MAASLPEPMTDLIAPKDHDGSSPALELITPSADVTSIPGALELTHASAHI